MPRRRTVCSSSFIRSSYARRLRAEQLEDRRLLATVTVGNTLDVVNAPDTSSIAALVANDGGDGVSLREAITAANNTAGTDTVTFDSGVFAGGGTITLGGTQLEVAGGLTIDASGLTGPVTVDANGQSRVIEFSVGANLTLRGLTITGGEVTGNGGGILASSGGTLTLEQSNISGNQVNDGDGGGISSSGAVTLIDSGVNGNTSFGGGTSRSGGGIHAGGRVTLTGSTVSGNSVTNIGGVARGGGIGGGDVTLIDSTVSGNTASGNGGLGGGVGGGVATAGGDVSLTGSTVSGNQAIYGYGGGISTLTGDVTLTGSTVSGNQASTTGGGIQTPFADVTLTGSTVSSNQSGAGGGGIYSRDSVLIQNSTITSNAAGGVGGGIGGNGQVGLFERFTLLNSIVAGNSDNGAAPDLLLPASPLPGFVFATVGFSLIGDNTGADLTETQTADANGNLIGSAGGAGVIDPQLGPLADNGGPTLTHALAVTSPAINAGDPAFDPAAFTPSQNSDQRGAGFDRVLFGRVDIGAFESPAFLPPQGLVVSAAGDVVDGDSSVGELSLREAILIANASAGADTITFDPAVFDGEAGDVIRLSAALGELEITEELTIDAAGLGVVISGDTAGNDTQAGGVTSLDATPAANLADNVRVLNFTAGSGDLTLRGLTISGGRVTGFGEDGGGIRFGGSGLAGALTLDQSIVSGNSATGSFADGGGIGAFSGNITLTESTVSGNQSNNGGGGLFTYSGDVTVVSSTISRNTATGSFATGGGLGTVTGDVAIVSSTVSENTTVNNGGGVSTNSGDVGIFNSTITGNQSGTNGGGLFLLGSFGNPSLTISSSIVAGNAAVGAAPDLQFDPNGAVDIDFSLIGDTSGSGVTAATGTSNLLNVDPLLGLLADNGGPTQTHALLVGSPAIDAGPAFFSTDQRGFDRNVGLTADLGAFERQLVESTTLVVSTTSDVDDGNLAPGELSLREAIQVTNGIAGADTIVFDPILFGTPQTIDLVSQLPVISADLTIAGPGADRLTLDAGNGVDGLFATGDGFRIFQVNSEVTLSGLTLVGGDASSSGGAILNLGDLTVEASVIAGNAATSGGGISSSGTLEVASSTLSENTASATGGGIRISDSTLTTVIGSTFSGNTASGGGGIANSGSGVFEVVGSTLTENSAINGGGILNAGVATLNSSIVANSPSGADLAGSFSGAFNLIGDGSGGLSSLDNLLNVDPLLGSLADNGGPTPTHALLVSSPAINNGDPAFDTDAIPSDQRGLPRLALSAVDIGAFELQETDLVVSTTDDVVDGNFASGELSLREAIAIANQRSSADTITFDPTVFTGGAASLIRVSSGLGELQIDETLTIDAGGLDVVITGDTAGNDTLVAGTFITDVDASLSSDGITLDDNVRVLNFTAVAGDLTLRGLTITGGNTAGSTAGGGGVRFGDFAFSGTLTVDQSTVAGNQSLVDGGGIAAISGDVTLTRSNVSDNRSLSGGGGGGISSPLGDVTLTESTVSGNESVSIGGGVATSSGAVTLISSTVSGNRTTGLLANGGGIATVSGAVTLANSTVTENQSSSEGGGVFVFNTSSATSFTSQNSIVAGNTAADAAADLRLDPDGAITIDFSLIGHTSGSVVTAATGTGNLLDVDPLLGPLADNGGPTQTHALLTGSPAIDAADPAFDTGAIPFDQRGLPRAALAAVDLGAFELQEISLVVSTTDDADDGAFGPGQLSLREAVTLANGLAGANTITFDPAVFTGGAASLIRLSGAELAITEPLTIDGSTGTGVVITGDTDGDDTLVAGTFVTDVDASLSDDAMSLDDNSRVIDFAAAGDLTLRGLTITGGSTTGNFASGVLFNGVELTLDQSTVSGNQGRGISTLSGEITLTGSTVSNNRGGGIYSNYGAVTLDQSTVSGNRNSSSDGGGITTRTGEVTLTDSTVSGNSTTGVGRNGGGIATFTGAVTLNSSTVSGNSSTGDGGQGGGIYSNSGAVTLTDSTLSDNSATGDLFLFGDGESYVPAGGGISTGSGGVTLTGSTVSGNRTTGSSANGGGINTGSGAIEITRSTVSGNSTVAGNAGGGGIYSRSGAITLSSATLTGNAAGGVGGAIGFDASGFVSNSQQLVIQNSLLAVNSDNGAAPNFNAPSNPGADLSVSFSLIGDNTGTGLASIPFGAPDAQGNRIGSAGSPIDPLLAPLADNGGPTQTHALLPGSLAINAGSSTETEDQRGFARNAAVGVDIGAYEAQAIPTRVPGDYNGDDAVDAADYTVWRDAFGSTVAPLTGADGDGDGEVTRADYLVWRSHFGFQFTPPAANATTAAIVAQTSEEPVEADSFGAETINSAALQAFAAPPRVSTPVSVLRTDPPVASSFDDTLLIALAGQSDIAEGDYRLVDPDEIALDEAFAAEEAEEEEGLAIALSDFLR